MSMRLLLLVPLCFVPLALADGPVDNIAEKVRPIPPLGIVLPQEDRDDLMRKVEVLDKDIARLPQQLAGKAALLDLLPDVQIYAKAVRWAVQYRQVYSKGEIAQAYKLLEQGTLRVKQLREGKPAWTTATGLVVRGYRSRIDGSVQPYGLVVPASYRAAEGRRHRLDLWLHGRGETLSELNFIVEHQRSAGPFVAEHAFVLHPYGRYCNAFKLAGEVDVLEALGHARKHYRIDGQRVVMRGFSMGGAGCWHMAVHYPDRWVAAAPGAGFSETPRFLQHFQKETLTPTWFEKKLWQLHDCDGWAGNLFNLPVVAYSGEDDIQKQAADVMAEAVKAEGLQLLHIIGPKTGHGYHPRSSEEIVLRINRIAEKGKPRVPPRLRFVTYSLRYDRSFWVRLGGLEEHWRKAEIDAALTATGQDVRVKTSNVSRFTLSFGPGDCPFVFSTPPTVSIDGMKIQGSPVRTDHSWSSTFVKSAKGWSMRTRESTALRKKPGLQGPIDDAFLDSFLMVRPTGTPLHDKTGQWAKSEMDHAIDQWRKQFRGDARVKDDKDVSADDIAKHNLVLWGDPGSNAVLKRLLDKLPLQWDAKQVRIGKTALASDQHMPILIYPNPLEPTRYVVLNSGFTMREFAHLNNARQVPKLPDWAVIDVSSPPSPLWPGKVVEADFFDEAWKVRGMKE